jgi:hypothetical protein
MFSEITKRRCSRIWNKFSGDRLPLSLSCRIFLGLPFLFLFLSAPVSAQMVPSRDVQISQMMDQMEADLAASSAAFATNSNADTTMHRGNYAEAAASYSGAREQEIASELRKVEVSLALEYFMTGGHQQFEIITEDGALLSRLKYSNSGRIPVVKGEARYDRFSIGGRFGSATLDKKICTDEDWNIAPIDVTGDGIPDPRDYQITRQYCEPKITFYDANLYYNLVNTRRADEPMSRNLLVDNYSFDVFGGYQYYQGKYHMIDPMTEWLIDSGGTWYYALGLPADIGLDSFYKIKYQGPRLGMRFQGQKGKWNSSLSLSAAYLKTRAEGWWNLREFEYTQRGNGGIGTDLDLETTYAITPSWSAGFGFNFIGLYQRKMKESGSLPDPLLPGVIDVFSDLDNVRDANNQTYGFTLILRYTW